MTSENAADKSFRRLGTLFKKIFIVPNLTYTIILTHAMSFSFFSDFLSSFF